jgi:hypothetical protein
MLGALLDVPIDFRTLTNNARNQTACELFRLWVAFEMAQEKIDGSYRRVAGDLDLVKRLQRQLAPLTARTLAGVTGRRLLHIL